VKEKTTPILICAALLIGVTAGRLIPTTPANAQSKAAKPAASTTTADADSERFQFFDSAIQGRTFLLDTATGRIYLFVRAPNRYTLTDALTGNQVVRPPL
jgi:hypothetical protein